MKDRDTSQDVTVRGGIINVPPSTSPTRPPRHQPDTPRTKKRTKIKPDHKIHGGDSSTTIKDTPPPPPPIADNPSPTAADPSAPPPDEPETDSQDQTERL